MLAIVVSIIKKVANDYLFIIPSVPEKLMVGSTKDEFEVAFHISLQEGSSNPVKGTSF